LLTYKHTRFESREPRITEVAASLHYLLDHLQRQQSIYIDSIANDDITGPDIDGPSIFVGNQLPVLPVAPPNTQSAIFSDRPARQRRGPARYREYVDTDVDSDDADASPNNPPTLSDRDNLRALRASIGIAIHKIKKYTNYLDQSPAYWAAMILHPGLKKRWIEKHLPKQQAESVIENFQSFFTQNYDQDGNMSGDQQVPSIQVQSDYLIDEDFYDKAEDVITKDEVTEYLSMPLLPVDDPLEWWRRHQTSLPKLARMAFDILSIPATSCEVERVFSRSKLVLSSQRHALKDDTIELLVCLKYWLKKQVV
jgi:hypothetical protein